LSEPLDDLLQRPGLAPATRLLVRAKVCVARADWDGLAAVCARGRADGRPRADFEEALLQGVLFFGFPRSVTAFETLARAWPDRAAPVDGGLPPAAWREAGRQLFDAIYGPNAAAVHDLLRGFHPAFHDFVLESAYGRVLSRPGLDPRRRELLAVGALAALDQLPQLVAHGRGALRFGAGLDEVREALVTALGESAEVVDLVRRIRGRDATAGPD
jgi:4-carboxymuconolactone decarboxylase